MDIARFLGFKVKPSSHSLYGKSFILYLIVRFLRFIIPVTVISIIEYYGFIMIMKHSIDMNGKMFLIVSLIYSIQAGIILIMGLLSIIDSIDNLRGLIYPYNKYNKSIKTDMRTLSLDKKTINDSMITITDRMISGSYCYYFETNSDIPINAIINVNNKINQIMNNSMNDKYVK